MKKCVYAIEISLDFINFNFNFLALYRMYFQNCFTNRSIKLKSFTSHLQHSCTCRIKYKTLAFGSSMFIRFNTIAHVVNIRVILIIAGKILAFTAFFSIKVFLFFVDVSF